MGDQRCKNKVSGRCSCLLARQETPTGVEVKKAPAAETQLRDWAVRVHRNLLTHSGIPVTHYFLLAALPDTLYLWREGDLHNIDRPPDYEARATAVLKDYFAYLQSSPEEA